MHYKPFLEALGKLTPSKYEGVSNHVSYFVVPFEHRFYQEENEIFIKKLKELEEKKIWKINNKCNIKSFCKSYSNIKENVLSNLFSSYDDSDEKKLKTFFKERRALSLSYANINNEVWKFTHENMDKKKSFSHEIIFEGIDLWFFKSIGFFVYKISSCLDLHTISSSLNRNLRHFTELKFDEVAKEIQYGVKDEIKKFAESIFGLEIVFDSTLSNYAKTITAVNLEEQGNITQELEAMLFREQSELSKFSADAIDVLMQGAYLLGTTTEFFPSDAFEPSDSYMYSMVSKGGIDIWKYWKGIGLYDTLAFLSYGKKGGGAIVTQARTTTYLLYIINLYLYLRLSQMDKKLNSRKFVELDNLTRAREELQVLKNHFYISKIANVFQPNEIQAKIQQGLDTKDIIDTLENNISKSHEFAKDNYGTIFSVFAAIQAFFAAMYAVKELNIDQWIVVGIALIAITLLSLMRRKIKDVIKEFFSFLDDLVKR